MHTPESERHASSSAPAVELRPWRAPPPIALPPDVVQPTLDYINSPDTSISSEGSVAHHSAYSTQSEPLHINTESERATLGQTPLAPSTASRASRPAFQPSRQDMEAFIAALPCVHATWNNTLVENSSLVSGEHRVAEVPIERAGLDCLRREMIGAAEQTDNAREVREHMDAQSMEPRFGTQPMHVPHAHPPQPAQRRTTQASFSQTATSLHIADNRAIATLDTSSSSRSNAGSTTANAHGGSAAQDGLGRLQRFQLFREARHRVEHNGRLPMLWPSEPGPAIAPICSWTPDGHRIDRRLQGLALDRQIIETDRYLSRPALRRVETLNIVRENVVLLEAIAADTLPNHAVHESASRFRRAYDLLTEEQRPDVVQIVGGVLSQIFIDERRAIEEATMPRWDSPNLRIRARLSRFSSALTRIRDEARELLLLDTPPARSQQLHALLNRSLRLGNAFVKYTMQTPEAGNALRQEMIRIETQRRQTTAELAAVTHATGPMQNVALALLGPQVVTQNVDALRASHSTSQHSPTAPQPWATGSQTRSLSEETPRWVSLAPPNPTTPPQQVVDLRGQDSYTAGRRSYSLTELRHLRPQQDQQVDVNPTSRAVSLPTGNQSSNRRERVIPNPESTRALVRLRLSGNRERTWGSLRLQRFSPTPREVHYTLSDEMTPRTRVATFD